jgi:hypothetical protein
MSVVKFCFSLFQYSIVLRYYRAFFRLIKYTSSASLSPSILFYLLNAGKNILVITQFIFQIFSIWQLNRDIWYLI